MSSQTVMIKKKNLGLTRGQSVVGVSEVKLTDSAEDHACDMCGKPITAKTRALGKLFKIENMDYSLDMKFSLTCLCCAKLN